MDGWCGCGRQEMDNQLVWTIRRREAVKRCKESSEYTGAKAERARRTLCSAAVARSMKPAAFFWSSASALSRLPLLSLSLSPLILLLLFFFHISPLSALIRYLFSQSASSTYSGWIAARDTRALTRLLHKIMEYKEWFNIGRKPWRVGGPPHRDDSGKNARSILCTGHPLQRKRRFHFGIKAVGYIRSNKTARPSHSRTVFQGDDDRH